AYRPGLTAGEPPPGAADADGFVVTVAMTSLTGCSGEAFSSILKSLGYASTQRPGPAITVAIVPAAAMEPVTPKTAAKPAEAASEDAQAESAVAEAPVVAEAEPALASQPAASEEAPVETPAAVEEPATEAPASLAVEESAEARAEEAIATEAPEEPASEAAPAKAAPTEPESIEIWRPQRHVHAAPRPREAGAHRQAPGQGAEDKQQRPPRRDQRPGNAPGKEGRPAGKPRFEGRPPRDDARARRPAGFAAPERRERQPDPDSPFAKLAALKAELEKKGK
ncbi:MAG: helicase domain-containing protein, partial [Methylocystaceae bacterium]